MEGISSQSTRQRAGEFIAADRSPSSPTSVTAHPVAPIRPGALAAPSSRSATLTGRWPQCWHRSCTTKSAIVRPASPRFAASIRKGMCTERPQAHCASRQYRRRLRTEQASMTVRSPGGWSGMAGSESEERAENKSAVWAPEHPPGSGSRSPVFDPHQGSQREGPVAYRRLYPGSEFLGGFGQRIGRTCPAVFRGVAPRPKPQ